jgi:hypothetical protein
MMSFNRYDLAAVESREQTLLLLEGVVVVDGQLQVLEQHGIGLRKGKGVMLRV